MAAVDYLLEIDGIKGESTDAKLAGTIEIESFSWGATNTGAHSSGTGGGAGKVAYQDMHFTTAVNKASPALMLACAKGQHIKKAVLHVRKQAGSEQAEYYTILMEDLLISSYQSGGHGSGSSIPTDQFSLNFTKIKFSYKPQKPDGGLDSAVEGGWDVKKNQPY
jgi:type VI secretion system secreted protein Hcp